MLKTLTLVSVRVLVRVRACPCVCAFIKRHNGDGVRAGDGPVLLACFFFFTTHCKDRLAAKTQDTAQESEGLLGLDFGK